MIEAYIYTAGCAAIHDYCWRAVGAPPNSLPDELSLQDLQNTKVSLTFHKRVAMLFIGNMETSRLDFLRRSIYNCIVIICREFTKQEAARLQKICAAYLADAQSFSRGLDSIIADDPTDESGYSVDAAALADFLDHAAKTLPALSNAEALKKRACPDTPENRLALAVALSRMEGACTNPVQLLICEFYSPQKYPVEPKWCLYVGIDDEVDTAGEFAVKHKCKIGVIAAIAAITLPIVLNRKKKHKR